MPRLGRSRPYKVDWPSYSSHSRGAANREIDAHIWTGNGALYLSFFPLPILRCLDPLFCLPLLHSRSPRPGPDSFSPTRCLHAVYVVPSSARAAAQARESIFLHVSRHEVLTLRAAREREEKIHPREKPRAVVFLYPLTGVLSRDLAEGEKGGLQCSATDVWAFVCVSIARGGIDACGFEWLWWATFVLMPDTADVDSGASWINYICCRSGFLKIETTPKFGSWNILFSCKISGNAWREICLTVTETKRNHVICVSAAAVRAPWSLNLKAHEWAINVGTPMI